MKYNTFKFCERMGSYLKKEDIRLKDIVLMQERVTILLHRLYGGDRLQNIEDLYEVHKSTL